MSLVGEIIALICLALIASELNSIAQHLGFLVDVVKKKQQ
jgi:hypothetical protein